MYRVYFDTNEGVAEGYGLWLNASMKDLSRIPDGPEEGMRVIIYMTGELEMQATLKFAREQNCWIALPIPGTTTYLAD